MSDLNMTEAFREYGAQLRSRLSDASAIAEDGALVLSCWAHVFRPQPGGGLRYEDSISTWPTNQASRTLLAEHLQVAFDNKLPVRLVIATAKEPPTRGENAMKGTKSFHIRKDMMGEVVEFDGDRLAVVFRQFKPQPVA